MYKKYIYIENYSYKDKNFYLKQNAITVINCDKLNRNINKCDSNKTF